MLTVASDEGVGAVDRPLERDDHRGHRVQQREGGRQAALLELVGLQLPRVHDRRHPEPRQQHELEQVLQVAGVDVERREQDGQPRREQEQHDQGGEHQPQVLEVDAVAEHHEGREQHEGLQEEVHEVGADRGEGQDLAREVHLVDERAVVDDRPRGRREARAEEVPRQQPRQQEDGEVGDAAPEDHLEHDVEDHQVHRRVQHRPEEPEAAVLVLDLQLLADQADEELAVAPHRLHPAEDRTIGRDDQDGQLGRGHEPRNGIGRRRARPHLVRSEGSEGSRYSRWSWRPSPSLTRSARSSPATPTAAASCAAAPSWAPRSPPPRRRTRFGPGSAYAAVCSCSGSSCDCGSRCCDGYTEFCCTLNGDNRCPPGSIMAGWWKADGSGFCGPNAPRYYMDCNASCGGCGCGRSGTVRRLVLGHAVRLRERQLRQPQGRAALASATGSATRRRAASVRSSAASSRARRRGPSTRRAPERWPPTTTPGSTTPRACTRLRAPKPALATFRDGVWRFRRRVESGNPEITVQLRPGGRRPAGRRLERRRQRRHRRAARQHLHPAQLGVGGRARPHLRLGPTHRPRVHRRLERQRHHRRRPAPRPHVVPQELPRRATARDPVRLGPTRRHPARGRLERRRSRGRRPPAGLHLVPEEPPRQQPARDPVHVGAAAGRRRPIRCCLRRRRRRPTCPSRSTGTTTAPPASAWCARAPTRLIWYTKNAFDGGQNQRQLTFGQPGDIPLAWGVPRT